MILVAIGLTLVAAIFVVSVGTASDSIRIAQAKDSAEKIAKTADYVYSLGPGAKETISLYMPKGVQFVNTSGNRVQIRVSLSSGDSDIFVSTRGQIIGTIQPTEQLQEITLTSSASGNVVIGGQFLSCSPASISRNIFQGDVASDSKSAFLLPNSLGFSQSGFFPAADAMRFILHLS